MLPRRALVAGGAALAAPLGLARAQGAAEQGWPRQPLRIVVPFAPGGSTDLAARLVAHGLQERLGQPVVVENRAGAGAAVGSQAVAEAQPDGYTLVMSNIASHAISPSLYRNVRYDPVRDFAHIALVISNPSVWVANKGTEFRALADVVRVAGANPRGLDVATSGAGSSNHLLLVRFRQISGANLNHVPYRGAGPAMTDVIAGTVPLMSDSLPSASAHVRQGSVRAIAMSSAERNPSFPDVPTFREQGFDLVSASWFGLSAPAGTPAPIVGRLAREIMAVIGTPEARARFAELGGTPGTLTGAAYAEFVREEHERWAPVVRASGATVE
jgi:tripartite-type tricarboxylate transporter receptor subunit TctC